MAESKILYRASLPIKSEDKVGVFLAQKILKEEKEGKPFFLPVFAPFQRSQLELSLHHPRASKKLNKPYKVVPVRPPLPPTWESVRINKVLTLGSVQQQHPESNRQLSPPPPRKCGRGWERAELVPCHPPQRGYVSPHSTLPQRMGSTQGL